MELKRAQEAHHHTTALLPVANENGEPAFEEVEIWFRPLTAGMLDRLEEASKATDMSIVGGQAHILAEQLVRWSITDEGREVEPTLAILKTLNRYQLDALVDAIRDYTFPKKTT